jgi:hypothetical protein
MGKPQFSVLQEVFTEFDRIKLPSVSLLMSCFFYRKSEHYKTSKVSGNN